MGFDSRVVNESNSICGGFGIKSGGKLGVGKGREICFLDENVVRVRSFVVVVVVVDIGHYRRQHRHRHCHYRCHCHCRQGPPASSMIVVADIKAKARRISAYSERKGKEILTQALSLTRLWGLSDMMKRREGKEYRGESSSSSVGGE